MDMRELLDELRREQVQRLTFWSAERKSKQRELWERIGAEAMAEAVQLFPEFRQAPRVKGGDE